MTSQDAGGLNVWGITYLPTLDASYAYCVNTSIVPDVVPRLTDIPANSTVFALAPFVSAECAAVLTKQAVADNARLLVLVNDTLVQNSVMISGSTQITIVGVSNDAGVSAFAHMSEYVSNTTITMPSTDIANTIERIGMAVQSDVKSGLPRLWIFVLCVLAGVLLLIILLSLFLNVALFVRRRNLRRRILAGEVNLELLGVKRLTVPQEVLDKIPVHVYTHGEQRFTSTSISTPNTNKSKSWKSRPLSVNTNSSKTEESDSSKIDGYFQTDCPICLEDFVPNETNIRELPCKHIYHLECIDPFLKTRSSLCPLCKTSTLPQGYFPSSLQLTNATVRREREMRMRARSSHANQANDSAPTSSRIRRRLFHISEDEESQDQRSTSATNLPQNETSAQQRLPNSTSTIAETEIESGQEGVIVNTPVGVAAAPGSAVPAAQGGFESLAITEEEEAAAVNRRPGWRRTLHRIFPV